MAQVYALMGPEGALLFASRKGKGWRVGTQRPDCGPQGRNLTVFADGRDVLGLSVNLSARTERDARRAAPFAVEDEIAEPIDRVHMALGPPEESERRLEVVSSALMQDWVDYLTGLRLSEAQLVAEHSVLPQGNCLVQTANGYLGQVGSRRFAADLDVSPDVLLSQVGTHQALTVYGGELAAWFPDAQARDGLSSQEDTLTWLAEQAEAHSAVTNLRQGSFKYRRPVEFGDFRQWKVAAMLSALLGVSWFANVILETHGLNKRIDDLTRVSDAFVEIGWPKAGGDVSVALASIQSERGNVAVRFPSVLTAMAILYESLGDVSGTELRSIRYEQARNVLSAVVAFDSFAGADQLEAAIESRGLSAQSNDARQSGNKIIGDVIIGRIDP